MNIEKCLLLIEEKFDKGSSEHWSTQDYEKLGQNICSKTGVLLSISTLKRLWGRVNHNSRPNRSTLNALAKYLDFEDWAEFVKSQTQGLNNNLKLKEKFIALKKPVLFTLLGIIVIVSSWWLLIPSNSELIASKGDPKFVFKSKVVASGIPNSVIFKYSAQNIPTDAKIEIQQSWDKRKRKIVNIKDSIATSIYYRPGYFNAKLVINDSIVKEDDVYIPTDGWMGLLERAPKPIYLRQEEFLKDNKLNIEERTTSAYGIHPERDASWIGFYNIREFNGLYVDNFMMETLVKNTSKQGLNVCQNVRVAILYDGGAIVIPLSAKGCISELSLMSVGDNLIDGKTNDLSGFGVKFNEFERVKCISNNGHLTFFVNDQKVLSIETPQIHKKIIGVVYNFEGLGIVKELKFSSDDGLYFKDNFVAK